MMVVLEFVPNRPGVTLDKQLEICLELRRILYVRMSRSQAVGR
jgi:hypothetical protein